MNRPIEILGWLVDAVRAKLNKERTGDIETRLIRIENKLDNLASNTLWQWLYSTGIVIVAFGVSLPTLIPKVYPWLSPLFMILGVFIIFFSLFISRRQK